MTGQTSAKGQCPNCGYTSSNDDFAPNAFLRPWSLAHGRAAVHSYVASLGSQVHEWLLALFVDGNLQLLAVDTVARGDIASCPVPFWKIIDRAHAVRAAGFILVHNHPSGDPTPSMDDIQVTRRLARVSHELNVPLLDHFVIVGDEMHEIAAWGWHDQPYHRDFR